MHHGSAREFEPNYVGLKIFCNWESLPVAWLETKERKFLHASFSHVWITALSHCLDKMAVYLSIQWLTPIQKPGEGSPIFCLTTLFLYKQPEKDLSLKSC